MMCVGTDFCWLGMLGKAWFSFCAGFHRPLIVTSLFTPSGPRLCVALWTGVVELVIAVRCQAKEHFNRRDFFCLFFLSLAAKLSHPTPLPLRADGQNNGHRTYANKTEAAELFLDFAGAGPDDARRSRGGVYGAYTFGPLGRRVKVGESCRACSLRSNTVTSLRIPPPSACPVCSAGRSV